MYTHLFSIAKALAVFKPCPQNKINTYIKTLGWDQGNLRTEHTKTVTTSFCKEQNAGFSTQIYRVTLHNCFFFLGKVMLCKIYQFLQEEFNLPFKYLSHKFSVWRIVFFIFEFNSSLLYCIYLYTTHHLFTLKYFEILKDYWMIINMYILFSDY